MKAATYAKYGPADVLSIEDIPRPEIGDTEVLVKVYASSVTTADWRIRASAFPGYAWLPGRLMFGLFRPRNKVLGTDFAGRVVSVGAQVTRFKLGDEVFGFAGAGGHAEYVAVSQDAAMARKPKSLDYEQAAAVPFGALSALVFLRDFAKLQSGERVLINGASGGVGVWAVQIAKQLGAHVTGVSSAANLDLVRSLGADRVLDYASDDITRTGELYDVILDTVGSTSFARAKRALTPKGRFVPLEFGLREIWQSLTGALRGGKRVVIGVSSDTRDDLEYLADLLARGKVTPVIDSSYALDRIAEAHRKVESRHKTGAVVILVDRAATPHLAVA